MKILENPRKLKNSPNLLLLFVKFKFFFEFSKKITKNYSFFELCFEGMLRFVFDDDVAQVVIGVVDVDVVLADAVDGVPGERNFVVENGDSAKARGGHGTCEKTSRHFRTFGVTVKGLDGDVVLGVVG